MATFFSNAQVGKWGGSVPIIGALNGSVSRSGNSVTITSFLSLSTPAAVSGNTQLVFYLNSTPNILPLSANNTTNLGSFAISSPAIMVSTTQTSQNITWQTSDGFGGQFTITFPAPPATPAISAAATSSDTIEITYGTTSFGSPSTGTVYLYGGTNSTPTTQIDTTTSTGDKTFTFTGLLPSTEYYFKATANNSAMSSTSSVVSATTKNEPAFYVPVNGVAKKTKKMYCSVNGKTKLVTKLYGSVNGTAKRIL